MTYYIYIYDNLINGKVYIGQTVNLKKRDNVHSTWSKAPWPIDRAIQKYGRENFSLNIITAVDTKERADYAEMDWIARAREHLGRENVYNLTDGGDGIAGHKHSAETRKKMSETAKRAGRKPPPHATEKARLVNLGKPAWNKNLKASDETKRKLSDSHMGHQWSEESKQKLSNSIKGHKPYRTGKMSEETKAKMKLARQQRRAKERLDSIEGKLDRLLLEKK